MGEEAIVNIRKRKPICLTFVRHHCADQACLKETYMRMMEVCKTIGMGKFDEVVLGEEHTSETLRERGLPELWMYDFQTKEKPTEPLQEYYVLKFDDGSSKVVLMLKDDEEPEHPKTPSPPASPPPRDPMYA
jgi:hypothetical protein